MKPDKDKLIIVDSDGNYNQVDKDKVNWIMEEPKALKRFRDSWERESSPMIVCDERSLETLRHNAIKSIKVYKELRKQIYDLKEEEKEVREYFKYLDKLKKGNNPK